MRQQGLVAVLAAVLTATAHFGSGHPEKNAGQHNRSGIAPAEVGTAEQALLRTFTQFSKAEEFHSPLDARGSCRADSNLSQPQTGPKFTWLIATVPDPEHSRMQLEFDREIEAMQNAAERSGYVFERYSFPWRAEEDASKQSPSEAPAPTPTAKEVDKDSRREDLPGVLLFHRKEPQSLVSSTALAIFLVTETPVSGIQPEQFRNAVCYGRSLPPAAGVDAGQLNLLGPGFSGSFSSLATLLDDPKLCPSPRKQHQPAKKHCFDKVLLRSWASDYESQVNFKDRWKTLDLKQQIQIEFGTTAPPSISSINRFISHIRGQWNEQGPVVLLVEGGTTFGSQVSQASFGESTLVNIFDKKVYTLSFPRNISTLRNATENETNLPGFADGSSKNQAPHTGLLLSLKGDQYAASDIPTYARQQTPVSQESVLFSLSALLKTGTVHYVGIVASDALDRLFLTRYLRSSCPNVRVFTLDSDLLLEHGSDSSDYAGTLAVTTSPLFPLSQLWTGSKSSLTVFPDSGAEQIYNAASTLLWEMAKLPTAQNLPSPDVRDYRNPFFYKPGTTTSAPLWITVATRSGYEPLDVLPPDQSTVNSGAPIGEAPNFIPEYWPGWGYTFYLLLGTCLVYCFLLCWASPGGNRSFAIFSTKPNEPDPLPRTFYLSAMGCCLSALLAVWLVVPGVITNERFLFIDETRRHYPFGHAPLLFCCGLSAMLLAWISKYSSNLRFSKRTPAMQTRRRPIYLQTTAPCLGVLVLGFISIPPSSSTAPSSSVLCHLCTCFALGCFSLGAVMIASLLPVVQVIGEWPANRANARIARYFKKPFWRVPYFWSIVTINGIAVGTASFACSIIFCKSQDFNKTHDASSFLAACRAIELTSGISPLLPATILLIGLLALAYIQLRRVTFYEDRCPNVPILYRDVFCPKLLKTVRDIRKRTRFLSFHPSHVAAFIVLAILCSQVFYNRSQQTFEDKHLDVFLLLLAIALGFFLMLVWIRFLLIWSAFNEFLQQLERHPLRTVFSLLPRGFVWSPVWQGGGKKRTHVAVTRSLECIMALKNHKRTSPQLRRWLTIRLDTLQKQVTVLLRFSAARYRAPRENFRHLESTLSKAAERAAREL